MTKQELHQKTDTVYYETKAALQAVYDTLNQGQQMKLTKNPAVAALFARYCVEI